MKPYLVTVEAKLKYTIEVHAETETEAEQTAEELDIDNIENAGEFVELMGVEAIDVECLLSEKEEKEEDMALAEATAEASEEAINERDQEMIDSLPPLSEPVSRPTDPANPAADTASGDEVVESDPDIVAEQNVATDNETVILAADGTIAEGANHE